MINDLTHVLEGFILAISLIMAIGAQNAFVLKQGLQQKHLLLTALTCAIADGFLIVIGVSSMAEVIQDFPMITSGLRWAGALFLITYGLRSFWSVFHPHVLIASLTQSQSSSRLATFIALLGFTFLNPHAYIDTILLLGTVGAEHAYPHNILFTLGAVLASFVWFFSLTYGASTLSPLFKKPRAWQILDTVNGFIMIGIAISLIT
jgi:L-lysine exporter family protein LysE/ArgO